MLFKVLSTGLGPAVAALLGQLHAQQVQRVVEVGERRGALVPRPAIGRGAVLFDGGSGTDSAYGGGGSDFIVGVVGALQFDVLADRIASEFDLPCHFDKTTSFVPHKSN